MFPTSPYETPYGGRSRVSLADSLVAETERAWLPPEDRPAPSTFGLPQPQTDAELVRWLETTVGVRIPMRGVCPGHSSPGQALCDAYFARGDVNVWKAARGFGGKTFTMGMLSWAEALLLRASVTLLGGSGEQSKRVHEYLSSFWNRPDAPQQALASDPTGHSTRLVWGNKVTALMASMASVSGPHPQRLRIDEVDLVDQKLLNQALGQPLSADGVRAHVVLSSAHYEADGTMTAVLKQAAERGWTVHEWCWRDVLAPHGWVDQAEVARTRNTVTAEMWRVQYDLGEPNVEGLAIAADKVERMFALPELPSSGDECDVEFEPPLARAEYATGADWARSRDYVEIVTLRIDCLPYRVVAYQRFRKVATPHILARFERQTGRYPGNSAHDATGGGIYLADYLEDSQATTLTSLRRQRIFSDWIVLIESEDVVCPRHPLLYRQHRYCRNADLWGAGHPPDGFVAGALAFRASGRAGRAFGLAGGAPPRDHALDVSRGLVPDPPPPSAKPSGLRAALLGGNGHGGAGNGNGNGSGAK